MAARFLLIQSVFCAIPALFFSMKFSRSWVRTACWDSASWFAWIPSALAFTYFSSSAWTVWSCVTLAALSWIACRFAATCFLFAATRRVLRHLGLGLRDDLLDRG